MASDEYWSSAPEAVPSTNYYSAPEVVPGAGLHSRSELYTQYPESYAVNGHIIGTKEKREDFPEPYEPAPPNQPKKRICGLASTTFWIVLWITLALVVGGGIGGGVGGGLAFRSRASQSSNSTSIASSNTASSISNGSALSTSAGPASTTAISSSSSTRIKATTTKATTASVTTTEVVGASTTLLRDCPSSDDTLHDAVLGTGETYTYRKYCSQVLLSNGDDYSISQPTASLDSCINECALWNAEQNQTEVALGTAKICNTVCWWNTLTAEWPGQCWGFRTLNASSGFQFDVQPICDSAAWINQPVT